MSFYDNNKVTFEKKGISYDFFMCMDENAYKMPFELLDVERVLATVDVGEAGIDHNYIWIVQLSDKQYALIQCLKRDEFEWGNLTSDLSLKMSSSLAEILQSLRDSKSFYFANEFEADGVVLQLATQLVKAGLASWEILG